jgi:gas vesicle protein
VKSKYYPFQTISSLYTLLILNQLEDRIELQKRNERGFMENSTKLGSIVIAATTFCGGIAAGLLLAPKKGETNRRWISKKAKNLNYWLHRHRRNLANKSTKELNRLRNHIQQGVKNNVPDLYEATESISLNNDEVFRG